MPTILCNIFEQATQAVYGAQTEITIFLFAFCIHALFFGRLRVSGKASKLNSKQAHMVHMDSSQNSKASSRSRYAKDLARSAENLCELKNGAEVRSQLNEKMRAVPNEETADALAGLLEGAGKGATPELLAAVRAVLTDRDLTPNVDLGEVLLRSYFALRLLSEFDVVFREVENAHGVVPSIGVLALKAAVRSGNLEVALERSLCLRGLLNKDETPSAGPVALLQQLVRLAAQERSLSSLLRRLQELAILDCALDTVLIECVQRGEVSDIEAVKEHSRKLGLKFGEAAYCSLIKGTSKPDEALRLFSESSTLRTPSKDLLVTASSWAVDNSDTPLADAVFRKLPSNPPIEAVGNLLRFHGGSDEDAGADAKVLQVYKAHFKGVDFSSDVLALRRVVLAAIRSGAAGAALLKGLLGATTETARVALLKGFGTSKQLPAALAVLRASPQTGACLYNATIDACIDCRSIEDAQQVMAEAVKSGVADTISYNTIIKAYLQAKRPREARQAVEDMKSVGLKPNCVTFNELLDGVVKANVEEAWPVLAEMRASGTRPNRITCAILLKAVQARTKAADVERVIAVLDELDEDLDEVLLCSVVDACIRAGRADLLMPQLSRQRSPGKTAVKGPHTYGSIIRAYGFVHDVDGAWETWREMRTRHVAANAVTLGCMVEALVTNRETEAGYELINEMLKDSQWAPLVNAVIYCSVLKGFSHQKRFDRMWAVYQEMLGHKLQFSIVTFNTLVDACSRNNEMFRIPALLQDMVSQGIPPNIITYSAILKGYCQENRIEEAFSVVEGMMQTTNLRPDEIMYNTLLDGCARQGLYERGMGVFQGMMRSDITPTNFTLSVLVKLASRSKKLDKAFELCQEISSKYRFRLNVHVYDNLMNACITNKDVNRALGVLETMLSERVRPDTRGYTLMLRAFIGVGQADDVSGLLRAAIGLKNPHPRLAKFDSRAMQAQGGLPNAFITEVLEGIAGVCRDEGAAVALLKELRGVPHVKLDPKLQLRLATNALKKR